MEKPSFDNPEFLDKRYPDLVGSKPVVRAVEKAREQGESPYTRGEMVESYLDRLETIFNAKNEQGEDRGFELLKYKILDEYVTKPEGIPESYWKLQENIMRERGQLGDWQNADEEQKAELKRQNAEGVLSDQRSSLEQWLDYFHLTDSDYIPRELKYWIFRNIIKLQEFDKEKKEFPKRSKGTVKQFPDINHEALSYVIDALMKKYRGESIEWENDIQLEERRAFEQYLTKEDFAKLYAWANDLMNPIPEHLLHVTEGEWRKFDQGSDFHELVKTIRGKGTGWCTAGEQTAKSQLAGGDFYVYYSLDDDGVSTIPRIAIRMEGDKIAEVRGVAHKQNLDAYVGGILQQKLDEFPDKEKYLKKEKDMQQLTEIEKKTQSGTQLSKVELDFLYEINASIEGFGYRKDPRIAELRGKRNIKEDLPIIFECRSEQIVVDIKEVNENTVAYIGKWDVGIYNQIVQYSNLKHLYESFPDKKIFMRTLETDPTIQTPEQAETKLKEKLIYLTDWGKDILYKTEFSKKQEKYELVRFTVGQLGFLDGATTNEIFTKAQELGLSLCPAEVGPQLRLAYSDQEYFWIAMKPIADRVGRPFVFYLVSDGTRLYLDANDAKPSVRWSAGIEFVFVRSRK